MGRMPSHRNLEVWQRAMAFVQRVYAVVEGFPREERGHLAQQLRRASVSIAANIAEGHGRRSEGAFAAHLDIALGSVAEVDTLLQLACNLGYLSPDELEPLLEELNIIGRMLQNLYKAIKAKKPTTND